MRITAIDIYDLRCELDTPFGWSQGRFTARETGLVRVATDSGLSGWGEGWAGAGSETVRSVLAPLLLGADPLDRTALWERGFQALYGANNAVGFGGSALSATDIALWDLAGQATGLPVWQLLGGRVRNRVPVYATGLYYGDGDSLAALLDEARVYVDEGYGGMKTKIGGLPVVQDVHRVRALRDTIGHGVHLMVDANLAYNATTAARVGCSLADADILWFEEPVNPRDIEALLQVKARVPMAIAGGENLRTRFDFRDFLTRRAFDIVQPDVAHCGGITEMHRIAGMASACGVQVYPHVWGSPIMIAASLHLAAVLPPCPPSRAPEPYAQEPVMEFDRTPNPIREELCREPFVAEGGFVNVPEEPGLGIAVDEAALERFTVRHVRCA